jgi:hypothetical protein
MGAGIDSAQENAPAAGTGAKFWALNKRISTFVGGIGSGGGEWQRKRLGSGPSLVAADDELGTADGEPSTADLAIPQSEDVIYRGQCCNRRKSRGPGVTATPHRA